MIVQPACWEMFKMIRIYQLSLDHLHFKTSLQVVAADILIKNWFGMEAWREASGDKEHYISSCYFVLVAYDATDSI